MELASTTPARLPNLRLVTFAVRLKAAAWSAIERNLRAADIALETGGILLGHHRDDHTLITVAGDPGPNAIHQPHRFLRDLQHARLLADAAWHQDRSQWIGEWHTHPTSEPVPSPLDLDSYLRHLRDPELAFTHFISVIVGVHNQRTVAAAWTITADTADLAPLTIEGVDP